MLAGGVHQALVDELLRRRMASAALAHGDLLGVHGKRDRIRMHQRVVEDDIGFGQQTCGAQRQQIGIAGAGADQPDLAG